MDGDEFLFIETTHMAYGVYQNQPEDQLLSDISTAKILNRN